MQELWKVEVTILFCFKWPHMLTQLCYLLDPENLEWFPYSEHIIQSHQNMCLFCKFVFNHKPCYIPTPIDVGVWWRRVTQFTQGAKF